MTPEQSIVGINLENLIDKSTFVKRSKNARSALQPQLRIGSQAQVLPLNQRRQLPVGAMKKVLTKKVLNF